MFDLTLSSMTERPKTCVLIDARSLFANVHNGPYYGLPRRQPVPQRGELSDARQSCVPP